MKLDPFQSSLSLNCPAQGQFYKTGWGKLESVGGTLMLIIEKANQLVTEPDMF